ncbi:MAG: oligosaccharide flippase family protein [Clostridia bacterium]|nr:oligosaccharide flippase family protein [Clostridia bacterium]
MKIFNVFIKNGVLLTIFTILLRLSTMLFSMFLSNNLPIYILGGWSIIMSIYAFFYTLSNSGINLATTRLVSKEYSYGDCHNIPKLLIDCLKYCLFFGVISALLLICFSSYILNTISISEYLIINLYLMVISVVLSPILSCISGYLMAIQKIKIIILSQIIETAMQILITLALYKLNQFTSIRKIFINLTISIVLPDIITFIFLLTYCIRSCSSFNIQKKSKKSFTPEILRISLPVAITTYIKSALSTIKVSIIPQALALYGYTYEEANSYYGLINFTILSLILFPFTLIQSYSDLLIPKISSYNPKKYLNKIISITKTSIFATSIFSIIICIIFILFAKSIDQHLYKTLHISYYLKILSPLLIYIYIDNVIDNILKSIDAQLYVVVINVIDLIVTISLIKTFIPIYGITAYILILYSSEILNVILSSIVLVKKFKNFSNKSL